MRPTRPIGPFLGVNNLVPSEQLARVERGRKVGDYLRDAVNVDVTSTGTLKRRKGVSKVHDASSDVHSLWGNNDVAFYVDGTTLFQYPQVEIKNNLMPGRRVSYDSGPADEVFWSNGIEIGYVADGLNNRLAPETPNPNPVVATAVGGGLKAGLYLIAFAAEDTDGRESPPTWPVQVEVAEGGYITVTGLSAPTNIYLSTLNGDVLFYAGSSSSTFTISVPVDGGAQLTTLGLRAMPAGHIVRWFNGRLLVARGSMLFFSEPYAPGLYNPSRNYIPFSDRITVVRPCGDEGVFIATRRETFYLNGADVAEVSLVDVLPYGAAEGTDQESETNESVWWFSERGVVIGQRDGSVKNVQEENVAVETSPRGTTQYREEDGERLMVASLSESHLTVAPVNSYLNKQENS